MVGLLARLRSRDAVGGASLLSAGHMAHLHTLYCWALEVQKGAGPDLDSPGKTRDCAISKYRFSVSGPGHDSPHKWNFKPLEAPS